MRELRLPKRPSPQAPSTQTTEPIGAKMREAPNSQPLASTACGGTRAAAAAAWLELQDRRRQHRDGAGTVRQDTVHA